MKLSVSDLLGSKNMLFQCSTTRLIPAYMTHYWLHTSSLDGSLTTELIIIFHRLLVI